LWIAAVEAVHEQAMPVVLMTPQDVDTQRQLARGRAGNAETSAGRCAGGRAAGEAGEEAA